MTFYNVLSDLGKIEMLYPPIKEEITFINENKVLDGLEDIVKNNRKVYLYGDYDPDGAMCVQTLRATFEYLGFQNYEIFRYSNRTHKVDFSAVTKAITEGFEYIIICDAGSSDPLLMKRLTTMGVKVILLDHHQSVYSYRDFEDVMMINTSFDNRILDKEIIVSAGALTYLVCKKFIKKMLRPELRSLSANALVSMYADSIDMSTNVARQIYYDSMNLSDSSLPKLIQRFMDQFRYSTFTRRFIEYHMNPKLNSLFRSENFELLNKLLLWRPNTNLSIDELMNKINEVYTTSREEVSKAADLLDVKVMRNFVVGNLSSVVDYVKIPENMLHNYTGLVANILTNKYGRTAVVYADSGTEIKGSLRDPYSRNYLEVFQQFCKANGHNSAFGIHVKYREFTEFFNYIELIDEKFSIKGVSNDPIVIEHNYESPDLELLTHMALYNEFSGVTTPEAYMKKRWLNFSSPKRTSYYNIYKWGDYSVKSRGTLRLGTEVIMKPYKSWSRNGTWIPEFIVMDILG